MLGKQNQLLMLIIFLTVTLVITACGQGVTDNGSADQPHLDEGGMISVVDEGDFVLQVRSPKSVYRVGEEVKIYGMLKYVGEEEEVVIGHAASPFWFNITENTRDITIDYVMIQPLIHTTLQKDEWFEEQYVKAGGFAEGEPHQEFMEKFLNEEGFPAGEYTIELVADFFVEDGGQDPETYRFSTTINIKVVE